MLLVDDQIDSGWTMTVAAALLRDAGAPGVLPLALATTVRLRTSPLTMVDVRHIGVCRTSTIFGLMALQATYGSAPVSLIIGRPATAQPVMPSATLTVFHPAPARAWAA